MRQITTKRGKNDGYVMHFRTVSDNLDNKMPVIEVSPPPELHLPMGPVNTLFLMVFGRFGHEVKTG